MSHTNNAVRRIMDTIQLSCTTSGFSRTSPPNLAVGPPVPLHASKQGCIRENLRKPAHMKPPACTSTHVATPNMQIDEGLGSFQRACSCHHVDELDSLVIPAAPVSNAVTTKRHRIPATRSAHLVSLSLLARARTAPFVCAALGCGKPLVEVALRRVIWSSE